MTRRLLTLAAGAALTALALTGCGADSNTDPAQTGGGQAVTDVTHMPGEVENYEGAAQDASTTKCERVGEAWEIAGTVKNSASEPRDYRIFVSLLSTSDTVSVSEVNVANVEPGASADWSAKVDVAQDDLECVLRVERFAPGAGAASEAPTDGGDDATEPAPEESPES